MHTIKSNFWDQYHDKRTYLSLFVVYDCFVFIVIVKLVFSFKNEPLHGKTKLHIGENKDADQLRGNREADHRLCFRYSDNTIPLLLKSEISSF